MMLKLASITNPTGKNKRKKTDIINYSIISYPVQLLDCLLQFLGLFWLSWDILIPLAVDIGLFLSVKEGPLAAVSMI